MKRSPMQIEIRQAWMLIGVAALLWGVNWPIMKVGLDHIDPLWFAAFRVLIAAAALFVFLGLSGRLVWPQRSDLPVLFSVGLIQVGACMALLHSSLNYVDAGLASVLAYTTPLWAAPLAAVFLGETITARKAVGIFLGLTGVAILFAPRMVIASWDVQTLGALMPLGSAILWAAVIVHIRGHGWTRPHLSLLPWQVLTGGAALAAAAWAVEGPPAVTPSIDIAVILGFNSVFATAIAFWAYIGAARTLPASTTALASLSIPVIGVLAASIALGEPLTLSILAGFGFIACGVVLAVKTGDELESRS